AGGDSLRKRRGSDEMQSRRRTRGIAAPRRGGSVSCGTRCRSAGRVVTGSAGKLWSLRRLADDAGRFKMLAVDQRPPIQQVIARGRGIAPEAASFADICAIKRLLVEHLAADVSAVLLDPNFAYPAAIDAVPARTGLIMTLEDHRLAETAEGRRSRSIADWSVEKIRRLGADGVKVLAWYRPDADEAVCAHQRDYVEAVGRACRAEDIPFVLELLLYPL